MRRVCCGRAGEEITHRYSWSIERNDKSMMNYFFVHQRSPPRLCAADLPGGSVWDDQEQTPPDDDVGSPGGIPVSKVNLSEGTHCTAWPGGSQRVRPSSCATETCFVSQPDSNTSSALQSALNAAEELKGHSRALG